MDLIIGLFILIIILIIIYNLLYIQPIEKFQSKNTPIDFNIDELEIIKRTPEYLKFIDNLINKKKDLFTDKELEILKKEYQFYIKNNKIQNISNNIYNNYLVNDTDNDDIFSNEYDDIFAYNNIVYNKIYKNLKKDVKNININNNDILVLNDDKYLKNYYWDIYGNKIKSNMIDYFTDYYSTIHKNPKECKSVDTIKVASNFIIPDQYENNKDLTDAYTIDFSRIINPLTIY